MKTFFIPVKAELKVDKSRVLDFSKKLPKNIVIAYSIQYKNLASDIKKILSQKHKIIKFIQILGCSAPVFSKEIKAILLIGSGKFHSVSLAFETGIPVYVFDNYNFKKIEEKEIKKIKQNKKSSYINFLNEKNIGILISTKPGQENLKKAINLKKKLKDKNSYFFIGNNIDVNGFENFGLKSWINTACPRMDIESNQIINASEIK